MPKAIQQSVRFSVSPKELFETYIDSKKRRAATGGTARVSRKAGGKFSAWNGVLSGRNLLVVPGCMIVGMRPWCLINASRCKAALTRCSCVATLDGGTEL